MTYIDNHTKTDGCVFCNEQAKADSAENLIAIRGERAYVILNRYPYTSGHVMAVPYAHVRSLEDLSPQARAELMELATHAVSVLRVLYHPQGFNLGINMGEAAGAGIADHVHLHIVPRWAGDTNFMTAVGSTRVLPETLDDSYTRICAQWTREDA